MNKKILDYVQHLSLQDTKTPSQKVLKCSEELGELSKVVLPYDNAFATTHRFTTREQILEESVDLMLCALSVAYDQKFTHEEIEEMMFRKAEKWQGLQAAEQNLKYPIPFEIHVTVAYDNGPKWADNDPVKYFKTVCGREGLKPVLLDLHTKKDTVIKDMMTSSKHFGTNASAYEEAFRIAKVLHEYLYDVLRIKIETVPWHPASPKHSNKLEMPKDCYFEAHIPVTINPEYLNQYKLMWSSTFLDQLHVSSNVFKTHEDGTVTIMLTYRTTDSKQEDFTRVVDYMVNTISNLTNYGPVKIGKVHKEFSIYDTKVHHDAEWLLKSDK